MALSQLTGTLLRERRLALGLGQSQLAAGAGISASYLNLIEHNRRKVTADVLVRLAAVLGLDPAALAEGGGGQLLDALRTAAADVSGGQAQVAVIPPPEADRAQDFAGRFPGWAGTVVALSRRVELLTRTVETLGDRINHDPHLSASLHEVLSAVSSVRSTAAILAESEDIDPDWRARFHRNLHQDSERLAEGAEALVAWLDTSENTETASFAAPQEELEAWLASNGWHFPALETGNPAALEPQIADLSSGAARTMARAWVARAVEDAVALPLFRLTELQAELGADPSRLAEATGVGVLVVMRRLATLPGSRVGLVCCDASGTLTFRKPVDGFGIPRFGAACALWPLFAALARPVTPVEQVVETESGGGRRFLVRAFCQPRYPRGFSGPELREAAMLILPDAPAQGDALALGSSCRVCARGGCPARREPSILAERS
jgi:transcriptional regulator with XRE-family HTH domain